MAEDKGYKETKTFICTGCGCEVVATKFASQKSIKCDKCKANKVPTNPEIVAKAMAAISTPDKPSTPTGETKVCQCIKCGKDVEVTKFASASKVMCDECKGIVRDDDGNTVQLQPLKIDLSKMDWNTMPEIDEYHAIPSLIANRRLREVKCPACGHEYMKILRVMDWSDFGLIINYQCPNCCDLVVVSEQCDHQVKTFNVGTSYDYSGNQITDLLSGVEHTRLGTTLKQLTKLCMDNNIAIDGIKLPPYKFEEERPVPTGFVIPPVDKWCSTIEDTIKLLSGNADGLTPDSEPVKGMVERLKQLFKEDNGNGNEINHSEDGGGE